MRKFFIILLLCLSQIASFGQEKHSTFKGIPIDGNCDAFTEALVQKGFEKNITNKDNPYPEYTSLKGRFAGFDNSTIVLLTTAKSKTVWKVLVFLPQRDNWIKLVGDYITLKEVYSKKYGEPQSFESFTSPYREGDGKEFEAMKNYKCTYTSFYKTEEGDGISLDVDLSHSVCISYEDSQNAKLMSKERDEEINEDI